MNIPDRSPNAAGVPGNTAISFTRVDSATLRARLAAAAVARGTELAVIDVRETLAFSAAHLIFSSNLSHNRLELEAGSALPRRDVPIVIVDADETLATTAAIRLRTLGYTDIALLKGGVQQWKRDGHPIYAGFNVRSKAFAECVAHAKQTPYIDFDALSGGPVNRYVILDSRTLAEYRNATVPGAVHVPGADLVRVVRDLLPDDTTAVVVACGGRTRSIIGAQSLIDAGLPNPVYALRNGTGGMRLRGQPLEHGASRHAQTPSSAALAWASNAAAQTTPAARLINAKQYRTWREDPTRTLYTFDLRGTVSSGKAHVPDSVNIAGGQLIQEIDLHAPVVGARVVLVDDDDLVRARMTGHWLAGLGGFEVALLCNSDVDRLNDVSPRETNGIADPDIPAYASITADKLAQVLAANPKDIAILDLSRSTAYRAAHLPGARWILRETLPETVAAMTPAQAVIITSEDGRLAAFAWSDWRGAAGGAHAGTFARVRVLAGGNRAWFDAGLPVEHDTHPPANPFPDVWVGPQARGTDVLTHVRAYLDWEIDLVRQVENDPDFNVLTQLNR
ncbi:TPA: rhodanese-related sulfurtransferase [Burkholderia multivorans]|uniref:rhodanese-like domain-containing protein n=1 Tax=Burkholderia multivorans TaxID=87883 RepID=UPI00201A1925|nr:rhodanese-like domain-containing protein [Burkholderia multivorans]MCO1459904.1 rhodanese-related sulfurtransferase [Burkholderia multivorans]UQO21315.1 rhodanese-related sulfurtransferase [Burkholderia multivorans]HEM7842900.1 rhodanese-related sulfurtransferase [Burkholderia multivorans]HEM7908285.1 rhodanese-related sulfurtransferase [Burkholderia multivorans]HEM8539410.1 rhodanese-related sulfurtransferase [Burkholderia multivorans]